MTRAIAARPYNHDIAMQVIAFLNEGRSIERACAMAGIDRASFTFWRRSDQTLTKLVYAAKLTKKAPRPYASEPQDSERTRLRDLESEPMPAGKEHYFVMGPSGRRSCAHCGAKPPSPSLKFAEGRCAPVGGVYYGSVPTKARRYSTR